jgi:hypothetical protein
MNIMIFDYYWFLITHLCHIVVNTIRKMDGYGVVYMMMAMMMKGKLLVHFHFTVSLHYDLLDRIGVVFWGPMAGSF